MSSPFNLDPIIRKVNGQAIVIRGEEVIVTIDLSSGRAVEKTFMLRVVGSYQDYLVANNQNPLRTVRGRLETEYVRDSRDKRTLALNVDLEVSCPPRFEVKVAEALHGTSDPAAILAALVKRWLRELIPSGDEGKFIDTYDAARYRLEKYLSDRAREQTGLELKPVVSLSRQVPREILLGPIEIGVRLRLDNQEQKITVEAGLELDPQNGVMASVFSERQEAPEELFKRLLKDYFFNHVSFDQFSRDLQYPAFKQPIIDAVSRAMKQVGRRVQFLNLSTKPDHGHAPPPEFVKVIYNYSHAIHGRAQPVMISNTVQLNHQDSPAFRAAGQPDLNKWVKDNLDVVLPRHLIGKTYVDLLLRFEQEVQALKRALSDRAALIGYRVDHLLSIPYLPELELRNPFILEVEDTFETNLDGFEVQLKFTIKLRIPKLDAVEKYINPGTNVKEAIKEMIAGEGRHCLRDVHPERFYLHFNHPKEGANGEERLAVKELLDSRIREALRKEFKADILDLTFRVGRSDLTERYHHLCHVIRAFSVNIQSPDPQATEDLTLTGNFVLRGVHSDSAGWQRFSVLQLDLDGLQNQLETHLKAELKTYYQSGFMFQNRMGRNTVFSVVKNCAGIFMREEFGLIIHLTNLDRNTTLAEENQRRLLIDLENNKLAAMVDQSKHLVDRLKERRLERLLLLSVSPHDKETLQELDESIQVLEEELKTISTARFGQHRLAATLEDQRPDELPPPNGNQKPSPNSELKSAGKGQLTG